jgi:hypothetical protein
MAGGGLNEIDRCGSPAAAVSDVCGRWTRDGLTVDPAPWNPGLNMALDAVSLMRARVRGTPSWPGHDPETGYVGADRSDHSQKLLADGAGHTFLKGSTAPAAWA